MSDRAHIAQGLCPHMRSPAIRTCGSGLGFRVPAATFVCASLYVPAASYVRFNFLKPNPIVLGSGKPSLAFPPRHPKLFSPLLVEMADQPQAPVTAAAANGPRAMPKVC